MAGLLDQRVTRGNNAEPHQAIEQTEEQSHVGVGPGGGHDVDVALFDVSEGAVISLDQRSGQALILNIIHQTLDGENDTLNENAHTCHTY